MASIEKRSKNSFRLIVEAGYDELGKRVKRYKTVTVSGIREAEKELVKFQSEVESGQYVVPQKISFSIFVEKWTELYGEKHLEQKTLENYEHLLKNHILPIFGSMKMTDVKPMYILSFLDSLTRNGARKDGKNGGLSTTTTRFIHRVLKDIFERAVEWQIISSNPVSAVKRPKIKERESEVYDEQEASKLFQALENEPIHWRIMVTLALTTGLRRGELLALEWRHIDFNSSVLQVTQSLSHSKGKTVIKEPKTKNSRRKVTIPVTLIQDLKIYHERCVRYKKSVGDMWKGGDKLFVFFSESGKPFYHTAPGKWLTRFIKRHELKPIRFHDLRHTSATLLINQGVHAKIIASRLGHADIRTTMNIYGHALQSADQAAADTFNRLLNKT
ncbi:site-specific integrase [Paenibacillus agaridevorans]|uniref:site-specific integrase n=1 Tax=Paenibacillus agaridevorans TaxID=171404 RepID=UPI001BE3EC7B|nr:site-specific integrase [Paenibacillus agaridevorans]